MPRTLDGLTVGDFDEITVNDDLTVKGNATLSGMSLDGSLTATAISASGDVSTTGNVSGTNVTASGTVSGATITASGNVSCANLTASGDVSCSTIAALGNNQFGDAIGDQQTLNGMVSINGQFVFVNDIFSGTNQTLSSSLNVGSGDLVVDHDDGELTIGCDTILDGEVSMAEGGSEAFNYNAHGLTNVGSIAMKTGGDITNCDEITCETLHVNSGLNLDGVSLDLGTGSLTANGGLNTTGSSVIRGLSCRAIDTNDNHVVAEKHLRIKKSSYNHGTMLNKSTFKVMANTAEDKVPPAGGTRQLWAAAYDFETFAKSSTESGLNTSDRAIPVSFTVKTSEIAAAITALNVRYDVFAMADCIIYIGLDGRMQTRI